jgi:hypothetical protein
MHIDKAKKRIAKRVKMGFQGYPQLSIAYLGQSEGAPDTVLLSLQMEEEAQWQEQKFSSKGDAREDEAIQSTIVKMMERCEVKTLLLI